MSESKNHHYNPKSILRNFTNNKNSVYVLNKETNNVFPNSIDKTGSENYFNTIRGTKGNLNFEILFDNLDGTLSKLTQKIVKANSIQILTNAELSDLALVIAVQYIRTKIKRTEAQDLAKKINEYSKEIAEKIKTRPKLEPELNDEEIKMITILNLSNVHEIQDILMNKDIFLSDCSTTSVKFMTSDNPVVMGNSHQHGQIGLNEKGIEVYYPIAPNLCVTYYCKSIRTTFAMAKGMNLYIDNLLNVIEQRGNLMINDKNVHYHNHLQLINSSQFVYSLVNNFKHEQEFLRNNQSFRKIESSFGDFTNRARTISSMPMGEYLAINTLNKTFKIKIFDVNAESDFTFRTFEMENFLMFTKADELSRIIYYKDQKQVRFMNEVTILNIEGQRITIGHKNRGLTKVIESILKK